MTISAIEAEAIARRKKRAKYAAGRRAAQKKNGRCMNEPNSGGHGEIYRGGRCQECYGLDYR